MVKKAKLLGAVVTNGEAEGAGRSYPKHAAGLGAAGAHMAGCVFTLMVRPQRIHLQFAQKEEGGEVAKNFTFGSSWKDQSTVHCTRLTAAYTVLKHRLSRFFHSRGSFLRYHIAAVVWCYQKTDNDPFATNPAFTT